MIPDIRLDCDHGRCAFDAIRREAQALKNNPELIQLRMAEKWDGVLPRVVGEGMIPLINLGDLTGRAKKK